MYNVMLYPDLKKGLSVHLCQIISSTAHNSMTDAYFESLIPPYYCTIMSATSIVVFWIRVALVFRLVIFLSVEYVRIMAWI